MQVFLDTYHFWSAHGVLPQAGGLLDQPATWVSAVRVVDSEVARITEEQMEERRKETERRAQRNR